MYQSFRIGIKSQWAGTGGQEKCFLAMCPCAHVPWTVKVELNLVGEPKYLYLG